MEFFSIKPEAFGLDISDSSLKIVKLKPRSRRLPSLRGEKRGKFFACPVGSRRDSFGDLASFGEFEINPRIFKNGEIKNEQALIKIIQEALAKVKGEKLNTKYVVASLPEQKAFLRVIQMPKMTGEELRDAIPFEAENYIPLPIEKTYLDFQVIPPLSEKKQDLTQQVLIVAFPKSEVNSYLSLLKKAGLQPKIFETESMAISRALIGSARPVKQNLSNEANGLKNEAGEAPVVLIDLGETKANFIIFLRNSIRFTSTIQIIEEKPSDLAEQIKKYIDYYQFHPVSPAGSGTNGTHYSEKKGIKKILLSGGNSCLKEFSNILSEKLKIPTELGNPWINILPEKEKPKLSPEDSLRYTTALGLALRGIKYD